ncbi:prolipoprotein diacylglyceryl transferase [Marivivens donghaensis]|uniref:Phosphatidylglycerol--prolipoprotein diacylglyceryl transferase n=1 Tax=Marivivens donghaensis TaxID=1699413 RepID=A0ABX0VZT4_9RHOB|nr:prolipoprotein diacylglyceryl transferase [Marivivens donghaensis]NIY72162.1 prolipoprotein diacylglyceryl transferase [Marivivens donghaensis]
MIAAIPFPDLSPEVFSINLFGNEFALRWYALAYIVGIGLGWLTVRRALSKPALWHNDTPPMDKRTLEDLMTWIIVGVILGGRFGYILFYRLDYYLANPAEIMMVWQGGMSFHGGFLGVILAVLIYSRVKGLRLGSVADSMALGTPFGLLLGRIANFVNAELWGRVTDVPWAVVFPGEAAQSCLLPVCARHPSQLYEAAMEGLILGGVLLYLAFRRGALKAPWLITGVFFAGYGISRFIVEFFRQPDAQFQTPGNPLGLAYHIGGYGLTMGQFLSLPMIIIGVGLVIWARKRA